MNEQQAEEVWEEVSEEVSEEIPEEALSADEHLYFENADVTITNLRAVFYGETYKLASVTSVSTLSQNPSRIWPCVFMGLGVLGMFIALSRGASGVTTTNYAFSKAFVGFITSVSGVVWLALQKPTYWVRIGDAGGESNVVSSKNRSVIDNIVQVTQQAMTSQAITGQAVKEQR